MESRRRGLVPSSSSASSAPAPASRRRPAGCRLSAADSRSLSAPPRRTLWCLSSPLGADFHVQRLGNFLAAFAFLRHQPEGLPSVVLHAVFHNPHGFGEKFTVPFLFDLLQEILARRFFLYIKSGIYETNARIFFTYLLYLLLPFPSSEKHKDKSRSSTLFFLLSL